MLVTIYVYNQFQKVYLILKFTENRDIWISNSGIFAKTKKKKLESKAELVVTQLSNKYYEWRSCVNWTNSFRYIWICSSAEREVISCNILLKMKKIIEKYRRKKALRWAARIEYIIINMSLGEGASCGGMTPEPIQKVKKAWKTIGFNIIFFVYLFICFE